jgi:hypothetical protein
VTLTVPSGHKFPCLSLKNVFCKYDGYPIQLQNGLSVHVKPKVDVGTSWLEMLDTIERETLGTFNHDKPTNSNFLIVATDPSAKLDCNEQPTAIKQITQVDTIFHQRFQTVVRPPFRSVPASLLNGDHKATLDNQGGAIPILKVQKPPARSYPRCPFSPSTSLKRITG